MTASREALARRQVELVAALVAGGRVPPGFDPVRVAATADALLHKRAGEVGARWPALRAQFGPEWTVEFSRWARHRSPHGSWRDGWDFARHLDANGTLGEVGRAELLASEARHSYDGKNPPHRRRLASVATSRGLVALHIGGRVWVMRRPF